MLRAETINDHNLEKLDAYVAKRLHCELLQSSLWLKFQERFHTARLFCFEHKGEESWFSAFEFNLPLGKKYLYIPRGPLLEDKKSWNEWSKEIIKALRNEYLFVRFEPDSSFSENFKRVIDIQPRRTLCTNLTKFEKDLLEAMHPKTRYNVRLALKKGLDFNPDDKDIDGFIDLMKETSERDKFNSHPASYYKSMFESGVVRLATVRFEGRILAAGLFAQFCDTVTYLHGASSSYKREFMAPYALHWEMMMYAKAQDIKKYDWHGIDEKKWPGFTRFKKGFGGEEITYPGTFDIALDRIAYTGYTVARGLRRLF